MGFLFSGIWGIVLILIGLSIILQLVFKINIPVFRIVIAFLLIYAGIRGLVGGNWFRHDNDSVVFEERGLKPSGGREYSVVFGKGVVEAVQPLPEKGDRFEVNTVFGSSVLRIFEGCSHQNQVRVGFRRRDSAGRQHHKFRNLHLCERCL